MPWWRRSLLVAAAALIPAAVQAVASVAGNVATGGTAKPFPAIERHPWLWLAGATALAAEASLLAWWAQRRYEQSLAALVPAVQKPPKWVVERPVEVDQVVTAVRKGARARWG